MRVGGQDADGAGGAVWHPRIAANESLRTRNATGAEVAPEARFRRRGSRRAQTRGGYPASSGDRRPRRIPLGIRSNETGGGAGSVLRCEETGDGSAVFMAHPLTRMLRLSETAQDTPRPVALRTGWIELTRVRGLRTGTGDRLVANEARRTSNVTPRPRPGSSHGEPRAQRRNWVSGEGGTHRHPSTTPHPPGGLSCPLDGCTLSLRNPIRSPRDGRRGERGGRNESFAVPRSQPSYTGEFDPPTFATSQAVGCLVACRSVASSASADEPETLPNRLASCCSGARSPHRRRSLRS